jgi:predicted enzyme related to lactoylglutathione lyase
MLDQVLQVTILVSDLKKAANFYSYVLGLPVITQSDRTAEFRTEGVILAVRPRDAGGQTQSKQPAAGSGSTQITFQVADLDVAFNEAKGRGAKVLAAPRTVDAGRMARVADPEGNIVELFEPEA